MSPTGRHSAGAITDEGSEEEVDALDEDVDVALLKPRPLLTFP